MMTQTTQRMRKIVKIDEEKCNGCGDCVPNCAEGAIKIINGKAKLVADNLCDGLGACLGHCPMDAITIEERPAEDFDEAAVKAHMSPAHPSPAPAAHKPVFAPMAPAKPAHGHGGGGGCPGSRMRMFEQAAGPQAPVQSNTGGSALRQWPVQLGLLPAQSPIWQDADLLLAADCVPFAYPDFHAQMLSGKTLAIACPKLDDVEPYVAKLAQIFAGNNVRSITIARMEVPCCFGLVRIVQLALQQSGKDIPVNEVVVGIRGQLK